MEEDSIETGESVPRKQQQQEASNESLHLVRTDGKEMTLEDVLQGIHTVDVFRGMLDRIYDAVGNRFKYPAGGSVKIEVMECHIEWLEIAKKKAEDFADKAEHDVGDENDSAITFALLAEVWIGNIRSFINERRCNQMKAEEAESRRRSDTTATKEDDEHTNHTSTEEQNEEDGIMLGADAGENEDVFVVAEDEAEEDAPECCVFVDRVFTYGIDKQLAGGGDKICVNGHGTPGSFTTKTFHAAIEGLRHKVGIPRGAKIVDVGTDTCKALVHFALTLNDLDVIVYGFEISGTRNCCGHFGVMEALNFDPELKLFINGSPLDAMQVNSLDCDIGYQFDNVFDDELMFHRSRVYRNSPNIKVLISGRPDLREIIDRFAFPFEFFIDEETGEQLVFDGRMSGSGSPKRLGVYKRRVGLEDALAPDDVPAYHPSLVRTLEIASGPSDQRMKAIKEQMQQYKKEVGDSASTTRSARSAAAQKESVSAAAAASATTSSSPSTSTSSTCCATTTKGAIVNLHTSANKKSLTSTSVKQIVGDAAAAAKDAVSVCCSVVGCNSVFYIKRVDKETGKPIFCLDHQNDEVSVAPNTTSAGAPTTSRSNSSSTGGVTDNEAAAVSVNTPRPPPPAAGLTPSEVASTGKGKSSTAPPLLMNGNTRRPAPDVNGKLDAFDTKGLSFKTEKTHCDCTTDHGASDSARLWTLIPTENRTTDVPVDILSPRATSMFLDVADRALKANKASTRSIAYGISFKLGGAQQTLLFPMKVSIAGFPDQFIVAVKTNQHNLKVPLVYKPQTDTVTVPCTNKSKEKAISSYMTELIEAATKAAVGEALLTNSLDEMTAVACAEALDRLYPDTTTVKLQEEVAELRVETEELRSKLKIAEKGSSQLKKLQETNSTLQTSVDATAEEIAKLKEKLTMKTQEKKKATTEQNIKYNKLMEERNALQNELAATKTEVAALKDVKDTNQTLQDCLDETKAANRLLEEKLRKLSSTSSAIALPPPPVMSHQYQQFPHPPQQPFFYGAPMPDPNVSSPPGRKKPKKEGSRNHKNKKRARSPSSSSSEEEEEKNISPTQASSPADSSVVSSPDDTDSKNTRMAATFMQTTMMQPMMQPMPIAMYQQQLGNPYLVNGLPPASRESKPSSKSSKKTEKSKVPTMSGGGLLLPMQQFHQQMPASLQMMQQQQIPLLQHQHMQQQLMPMHQMMQHQQMPMNMMHMPSSASVVSAKKPKKKKT